MEVFVSGDFCNYKFHCVHCSLIVKNNHDLVITQFYPFQFIAVNVFWAVVHYLIWDGKASTKEDVIASILSPGSSNHFSPVVFILFNAFFSIITQTCD